MDYSEAMKRIHEFEKFGSVLGLDRISRLMAMLGDPQDRIRIVHVAGTNGKGSVCRYIYSVLMEAGCSVGLYTSPFLERFTERIEVDGAEISEAELAAYAGKVLQAVEVMTGAGHEPPTEFEIITAIGFCYFADRGVDWLVLEVGLGGAGDATNIVRKPELSVITSISYDHMDYLGDTLEEIAAEKAGIIKPGVPVVSNVADIQASEVIRAKALECGSSWHDAAVAEINILKKSTDGYRFYAKIEGKEYHDVEISMIGRHQTENAACALTAIEVLRTRRVLSLDDGAIYRGIRKAKQAGRMEIIRRDPFFIIDGAHNGAGAEALSSVISDLFDGRRIIFVIGLLKDKKADEILDALLPKAVRIVATEPDNPRRLSASSLQSMILAKGRACELAGSAAEAVAYAEQNQTEFDLVIFAGSLYLIGKVRSMLNEKI